LVRINDRREETLFKITALAIENFNTSVLDIRSNHCDSWY
jgi:hypothetical protein